MIQSNSCKSCKFFRPNQSGICLKSKVTDYFSGQITYKTAELVRYEDPICLNYERETDSIKQFSREVSVSASPVSLIIGQVALMSMILAMLSSP